jgi:hypothetical protein
MKIKTWGFMLGVLLLAAGGYTVVQSPYKLAEVSVDQLIATQTEENSSLPGSDRRDDRRYDKAAPTFDVDRNDWS